ncbi:condensation domain-containing protein [Streptomyces sp. NPDC093250]|uniref:condensation domain-containing protein n=1 Tax=Streptomyces sp. NPDC093250 TaxID=3366036 RepID=UPI0037F63105
MADAPPALGLPTDRPRQQSTGGRTATADFRIDAELTGAVERAAAEGTATPFMVCLTVYALLLARLTDSDDIVMGTPVTNRTRPELEPLIGFFLNTLILRVSVDRTLTFRELPARVKAHTLEMFEHADTPYELLVERLNPVRAPGYNPVVQAMFTQQTGSATPLRLAGTEATAVPAGEGAGEYDLVVSLQPRDGHMRGRVFYAERLFLPETIENWTEHYRRLLDACTRQPDKPLYALDLGTPVTTPPAPAVPRGDHNVGRPAEPRRRWLTSPIRPERAVCGPPGEETAPSPAVAGSRRRRITRCATA